MGNNRISTEKTIDRLAPAVAQGQLPIARTLELFRRPQ